MTDVAQKAGVSVATVSHVLNETRFVRDETRTRVLDAIEQTGYIQNSIARSLAKSTTQTLGLAISAISNPYFMGLVHAIETETRRAGYTLLLADTRDDPDEELRVVQTLHQRRVDGYLCAPTADPERRALQYLADHSLPTVLVDRLAWDRFDQVGSENREATSHLVEHLASNGHRRIALMKGLDGLPTTIERVEGYRLGLKRSGLPFDAQLVASGASDVRAAQESIHYLLEQPVAPTAVVAANNRMTIGVMRGLRDLGLDVPRDIALVSFDDFEWADLFHPRLTAVSQPIPEMAALAVRMLTERLLNPHLPGRTVQLTPRFMHRDSCGCPTAITPRGSDTKGNK
jgi:LacI family transcriptional regulator